MRLLVHWIRCRLLLLLFVFWLSSPSLCLVRIRLLFQHSLCQRVAPKHGHGAAQSSQPFTGFRDSL